MRTHLDIPMHLFQTSLSGTESSKVHSFKHYSLSFWGTDNPWFHPTVMHVNKIGGGQPSGTLFLMQWMWCLLRYPARAMARHLLCRWHKKRECDVTLKFNDGAIGNTCCSSKSVWLHDYIPRRYFVMLLSQKVSAMLHTGVKKFANLAGRVNRTSPTLWLQC